MSKLEKRNQIPFVDLYAQYASIRTEIDDAIKDVIYKSSFIRGEYVDQFEKSFANLTNTKYCISCANGTDALYISMIALGLKPCDEVIVPSHSWISTSETVTQAGGKVVFCDTYEDLYTINVEKIESKITNKTVGIIPVHLYGQPAEMDTILKIAKKYNLWIIEDCAQAHLAKYKNKLVGTFGDAATFSFYPGKNLGAMGDAGAIVTNNEELSEKMAMFARHGGLKKGDHIIEGINSRMDGIQAAILLVKINKIKEWTKLRQKKATYYLKELSGVGDLVLPSISSDSSPVWHLFVIKTSRRNELAVFLKECGIQTVINYPISLPFLDAYKYLGHKPEDFPNSYKNQSKILSIPIYPELTIDKMDRIIVEIKRFFENINKLN